MNLISLFILNCSGTGYKDSTFPWRFWTPTASAYFQVEYDHLYFWLFCFIYFYPCALMHLWYCMQVIRHSQWESLAGSKQFNELAWVPAMEPSKSSNSCSKFGQGWPGSAWGKWWANYVRQFSYIDSSTWSYNMLPLFSFTYNNY